MIESPKSVLARHGLRPKQRFGQNFLGDTHLAARIAEIATTPPGGTVVEIGAGLGALTLPLLARAARVVAIERDRDLVKVLKSEIHSDRLTLVEADAKQVPFDRYLGPGPQPRVLAGNLPYQITGPLLLRATQLGDCIDRVVFLLQLEVADRLAARPGTASYGALTVFIQARFVPSRAIVIRRGAFYPQPGVDSAVVVLEPRPDPIPETPRLRALVKAAFEQRRKQLRNALAGLVTVEQMQKAGIDPELRGEMLAVTDFARLAEEVP